jgi:general stress protein 26
MAMSGDVDHAWDLLEEIETCMLVTRDGRALRGRPMRAYVRRHEKAVYFLTDIRNHKDDEVKKASNVCLAFADTAAGKYVSASGRAQIIDDRVKVKELWSTSARTWWETPDDPNIRIMKVTPSFAEFWDNPEAIVSYVEMAAAALAGEEPVRGENRKVRM